MTDSGAPATALHGLKVVDTSTLFAGPLAAMLLADFGADVVKVEHPKAGDPARGHGHAKDGIGLWWKMLGRNKRAVTCYLGDPDGRELFLRLLADADVLIENFRPGTLERWDLAPETLHAHNPGLVIARVTGFGQFGPMAHRAGFGTLAESMSGFAAITGQPDGPPTLPPFGLADGITALATAFAVMTAIESRHQLGRGQVIDISLIEPILTILGSQPIAYDQLGVVQQRTGNRSVNNAPRNTYLTRDQRWLAVSTSAQTVAERVMHLVGRSDLIDEPWFASGGGRAEHADVLDDAVGGWIAQRDADDVIAAFEEAQAAVAPIYDIRDIMSDPQYAALRSIIPVSDPDFGRVRMQNVLFRLSETPGEIRWTGAAKGADNDAVYGDLGVDPDHLAQLRTRGII
jgi:crotonobetainyl-CoA:carnitine CoA-transferase CaiB-like acyl-CoA transferase